MNIKTIDHIAISTVDIEESIRFYSEVMGFTLLKRIPNGDNALVYLKIDDTTTIELFDHEKEIRHYDHPDDASGLTHIAFNVDNINEWNEHLKKHNVEFTLPLCSLEHIGKSVLLFKDPNSAIIELMEDL